MYTVYTQQVRSAEGIINYIIKAMEMSKIIQLFIK
jgi:hypothetical protein